MGKRSGASDMLYKPLWAQSILQLRRRLRLDQASLGRKIHSSAMAVSRWERGVQEPLSHSYIALGNLAGDPDCWYFWERAGLHNDDLMRAMPQLQRRLRLEQSADIELVRAGSGGRKATQKIQVVAIPLVKIVAPSRGGPIPQLLRGAPVEGAIAAPKDWCPNPAQTTCLRVQGSSMAPLIGDGFIVAVDSSQTDNNKLDGKIVVAWNKDKGLAISRLRRYDDTEVLQPENQEYESITLNKNHDWKILAKVLWWIGKAP